MLNIFALIPRQLEVRDRVTEFSHAWLANIRVFFPFTSPLSLQAVIAKFQEDLQALFAKNLKKPRGSIEELNKTLL